MKVLKNLISNIVHMAKNLFDLCVEQISIVSNGKTPAVSKSEEFIVMKTVHEEGFSRNEEEVQKLDQIYKLLQQDGD